MAVSTLASFAFSNRLSARNVCGSKDVFTRHTLNSDSPTRFKSFGSVGVGESGLRVSKANALKTDSLKKGVS